MSLLISGGGAGAGGPGAASSSHITDGDGGDDGDDGRLSPLLHDPAEVGLSPPLSPALDPLDGTAFMML